MCVRARVRGEYVQLYLTAQYLLKSFFLLCSTQYAVTAAESEVCEINPFVIPGSRISEISSLSWHSAAGCCILHSCIHEYTCEDTAAVYLLPPPSTSFGAENRTISNVPSILSSRGVESKTQEVGLLSLITFEVQ